MTAEEPLLGLSRVSTVSPPALQQNLSSVLDEVVGSGRPIFVVRHNRPIVVLMRVDEGLEDWALAIARKFARAKGEAEPSSAVLVKTGPSRAVTRAHAHSGEIVLSTVQVGEPGVGLKKAEAQGAPIKKAPDPGKKAAGPAKEAALPKKAAPFRSPRSGGAAMSRSVENDLAQLKGIGPQYAQMLDSIGVDSIKDLRHRNPAHLKEMIERRHGKVVGLSAHKIETWIEEAKAHQP